MDRSERFCADYLDDDDDDDNCDGFRGRVDSERRIARLYRELNISEGRTTQDETARTWKKKKKRNPSCDPDKMKVKDLWMCT